MSTVSAETFDFLEVGLPIEVQVPLPGSEMTDVYFSQIMNIDARGIHISAPQRQGQVAQFFGSGDTVFIRIGYEGAFYTCHCQMLGWSETTEGMVLSLPRQVERLQRRRFVRVAAVLPVIVDFEQNGVFDTRRVESRTTDLSGGGMMVTSPLEMPIYTEARVKLTLPPEIDQRRAQGVCLFFVAQVCRCVPTESGFQIGLSFDGIPEKQRDQLIRYIFCLERENIRSRQYLNP